MAEYWQALRSFSPSVRRLLLAFALVFLVGFGMIAVLQNLFLLRLGFDSRFIGMLAGAGQLAWAASALPAGMLSNRIGLRNGMILGIGLFGLSILLLVLVETQSKAHWPVWLLGSQIITNMGIAVAAVSIPPYLMAVTTERERSHAFASFQALIPAAGFVGSLIAGLLPGLLANRLGMTLDQPDPYRLALWVGPILVWLGILPLLGADRVQITGRGNQQASTERAPLRLLAFFGLVTLLASVGEGAIRIFFNVYLDTALKISTTAIGSIMGFGQLLPVGFALLVPVLMARWGTGRSLLAGILAIATCLMVLAAIPLVGAAALGYVGVIAAFTLTNTSRDLFGQELVAPRWRTNSQGAAMLGVALGFATAGMVGGTLVETVGFGTLFIASALAVALAAVLLMGYLRTVRGRAAGESPVVPAAPSP